MIFHTVESGETLTSIARLYGSSPTLLASFNGMPNPNDLAVGQCVVVVKPEDTYRVEAGDTLSSIAERYGTSVNALYRSNPSLEGKEELYVGEELVLSLEREPIGSFETGGYVYPFINRTLLAKTLPYINYLMPFTYGFTSDGELVRTDDAPLLSMARHYGTKCFMHLSTLTADGHFSNELASVLLDNGEVQKKLTENILENIRAKGYAGLDVDFEFVYAKDAYRYAEFIAGLREALNAEGYAVITALAPKVSDDQPGLLYEGHLYREIGEAANAVLLMTYEWGYTYGPPMAVSPLGSVRRVLDYAVTRIEPGKIFMGMSNYGYDWTLPYVRGESRAVSISTNEALLLASKNRAEIRFDQNAASPYFYYTAGGKAHEVWFEDARSIAARLALIPEYGLRGCLYWNLMRPNMQNLLMLELLNEFPQEP